MGRGGGARLAGFQLLAPARVRAGLLHDRGTARRGRSRVRAAQPAPSQRGISRRGVLQQAARGER